MDVEVRSIRWLGIPTERYGVTRDLFERVMGLRVNFDQPTTVELTTIDGDQVQLLAPGNPYFDFFTEHARGPVPLFEVDDVRVARAELEAEGIAIVGDLGRAQSLGMDSLSRARRKSLRGRKPAASPLPVPVVDGARPPDDQIVAVDARPDGDLAAVGIDARGDPARVREHQHPSRLVALFRTACAPPGPGGKKTTSQGASSSSPRDDVASVGRRAPAATPPPGFRSGTGRSPRPAAALVQAHPGPGCTHGCAQAGDALTEPVRKVGEVPELGRLDIGLLHAVAGHLAPLRRGLRGTDVTGPAKSSTGSVSTLGLIRRDALH